MSFYWMFWRIYAMAYINRIQFISETMNELISEWTIEIMRRKYDYYYYRYKFNMVVHLSRFLCFTYSSDRVHSHASSLSLPSFNFFVHICPFLIGNCTEIQNCKRVLKFCRPRRWQLCWVEQYNGQSYNNSLSWKKNVHVNNCVSKTIQNSSTRSSVGSFSNTHFLSFLNFQIMNNKVLSHLSRIFLNRIIICSQ